MANRWTQEEISFLKENYSKMSSLEIANTLNRTIGSVQRKKERLSLRKLNPKRGWTQEELDFIYSSKMTYDELAEKFNATREQIRYLFKKNKNESYINTQSKFNCDEDEYIKQYGYTLSDFQIAKDLGRSPISVGKRRRKLGVTRPYTKIIENPPENRWTKEEDIFLIQNINELTYQEIAERLNRSIKGVMIRASRLKLITNGSKWSKKEDELLKKYASYPIVQIAFMLDRSFRAIDHRLKHLGLKSSGIGPQSSIEEKFEAILNKFNINYLDHVKLGKDFNYEADYVVGNIVIEVNGDYWHANPIRFPEPTEIQKMAIEKDKFKKEYFESLGYKVFEIWESEINDNIAKVEEFIARLLSDQQDEGSKIGEVLQFQENRIIPR